MKEKIISQGPVSPGQRTIIFINEETWDLCIEIYTQKGELIWRRCTNYAAPGQVIDLTWDGRKSAGRKDDGERVAMGIYRLVVRGKVKEAQPPQTVVLLPPGGQPILIPPGEDQKDQNGEDSGQLSPWIWLVIGFLVVYLMKGGRK